LATIVLSSAGTTGDFLPILVLARELGRRGHTIRLPINEAAHAHARALGLEPLPCGRRFGPEEARAAAHVFDAWRAGPDDDPPAAIFERIDLGGAARAIADAARGADLLLASSIQPAAPIVAEVLGIRWASVFLAPAELAADVARGGGDRADRERDIERRYDLVRAEFGLPPLPPGALRGRLWSERRLLLSSPVFSVPPAFPAVDLRQAGFLFYDAPAARDEALEAFLAGGEPPLLLALGSQPLRAEARRRTLEVHVGAARALGCRLVVQSGWAGLDPSDVPHPEAGDVLVTGFVRHDGLLPRVAAVITHGGIGTCARAIRAGVPLVVEPHGNDQFFNARRVVELGLGAAIPPPELEEGRIVRALEAALLPPRRARVARAGAAIAREDAIGAALAAVEAWASGPGGDPLAPLAGPSAAPGPARIPPVVHQSWRDARIPGRFQPLAETWRASNPGFAWKLWTDEDNRALVRDHYPWLLDAYDAYPEPIMRADAARYLVLHRHGGVYADLDLECLRPVEPLLAGRDVVLGLEPASHLATTSARGRGFERIVGNAFLASAPGDPFWEHVFGLLLAAAATPSALDATGPYLLTRAVETYARKERLTLLGAPVVNPLTSLETEQDVLAHPHVRERLRETAYAVHHWAGTWWRRPDAPEDPLPARILDRGRAVAEALVDREAHGGRGAPLVSALLVTRGRPRLARRAIKCYRAQTYPASELVVLDGGPDDALARAVEALGDPRIRRFPVGPKDGPLGALRNRAVAEARGDYICQWDDDDLSAPDRIELQMAVLRALGAAACFLQRVTLLGPAGAWLGASARRAWEGTILAERTALPPYPPIRRGEDTPACRRLVDGARVALLDRPDLFVYSYHGRNTFDREHFERHWAAASERWEGAARDALAARIPGFRDALAADPA
jgi:UDP:flavonoid glycosyltransferase YjiC (YdhE family)